MRSCGLIAKQAGFSVQASQNTLSGVQPCKERSSAVQSLEMPGKVGSPHESQNVGFQRIKTQVMKRLNRSSYNRTIHSLDLAAIPRMVRLG